MFKFRYLLPFLMVVSFGSNLLADLTEKEEAKLKKVTPAFAEAVYKDLKGYLLSVHKPVLEKDLVVNTAKDSFELVLRRDIDSIRENIPGSIEFGAANIAGSFFGYIFDGNIDFQSLVNKITFLANKHLKNFVTSKEGVINRTRRYIGNGLWGIRMGLYTVPFVTVGYIVKSIWPYLPFFKERIAEFQNGSPIVKLALWNLFLDLYKNNKITGTVAIGAAVFGLPLLFSKYLEKIETAIYPKN